MQLSQSATLPIGLPGGSADSWDTDNMSRTAIEAIPFGRIVAAAGNILYLVMNTSITTGTIDLKINGTAITQVTYATSHLVTAQLIADAINVILGDSAATVGGTSNLTITIVSPTNSPVTVSNWVSSQGVTVTHTVDTDDDLCRLPRQNKNTITLAGAMVTGDTLSGYLNGSTTLLSVTFSANSVPVTLGAMATLIAAEPGIKSATVAGNTIVVLADDHQDVTAVFTSTTQAVTYVEDTTDTFLGVAARELKEAGTSTDAQFLDGDAVGVTRKGRRFVESTSAAALTRATPLFVTFAPGDDRGKITDAAGTNPVTAKAWTAIGAYKNAAAASLTDIELNQP